jgi:hypothetical protein
MGKKGEAFQGDLKKAFREKIMKNDKEWSVIANPGFIRVKQFLVLFQLPFGFLS